MVIIKTANNDSDLKSVYTIEVTPDLLRQIADRLEQEEKNNTLPGQYIRFSFTKQIDLIYNPDVKQVTMALATATSFATMLTNQELCQ